MNFKKYIISVFIISIFSIFFTTNVNAKTLADFKKELSAAEAKYSKNESDKQQTESDINATKEKINSINAEKIQISKESVAIQEEIEKIGEEIEKMQEEIKSITHYYQLSNSNSLYLEYAFSATDFTDFIYRLAVSEQLSEYRERTIDEYNALMDENREKINQLAKKQASLSTLESELSVELSKLDEDLSDIADASVDVKKEIAELKTTINTYENKYKCSDNEQISTCIDRYNNRNKPKPKPSTSGNSSNNSGALGNVTTPSATGFYRPTATGRVTANYGYTEYYGSFHDGFDIGVAHGTNVYPIADGYVAKITYKSSCGGNMVYIVHKVGGATYTSAYFHLATVNVSVGQNVTHNTVIGSSGGVPSIETWDKCTTGAHLHLQLGTGAYMSDYFFYSNFAARKFDPRRLINFPAMGSYYSGR